MAQDTTWTGAALTESDINTYLMHEGGAWSSWTPVVTQSNTPTLTVTRARYARLGRTIIGSAIVTLSSSGTAANSVTITLPVAMSSTTAASIVGEGWIFDTSTGFYYHGELVRSSSTTVLFFIRTNGAVATYLGTTSFTAALATGDVISINFYYEAAS